MQISRKSRLPLPYFSFPKCGCEFVSVGSDRVSFSAINFCPKDCPRRGHAKQTAGSREASTIMRSVHDIGKEGGGRTDKLVISLQRGCMSRFPPTGKVDVGHDGRAALSLFTADERNNCNDAYNYCVFTGARSNDYFAPAAIFGQNARINDDPPRSAVPVGSASSPRSSEMNSGRMMEQRMNGRTNRTAVDSKRIN